MSNADNTVQPVPGPRWTRKRLIGMLLDCYGPTSRGTVDVAAVAEYAGVSRSTVRRWIAGRQQGNRRKLSIPKHRIGQLQRGPEVVERRNQQQYQYALDALGALGDERSILPAWRQQGWLNEHTLAIVEIHGKPWHQVVVTKANRRALTELQRRATAGQRHAADTVSRPGARARGDDPPTSLAGPPHTAAARRRPHTRLDVRRASSGSHSLGGSAQKVSHLAACPGCHGAGIAPRLCVTTAKTTFSTRSLRSSTTTSPPPQLVLTG
jgi:hypothetical protein